MKSELMYTARFAVLMADLCAMLAANEGRKNRGETQAYPEDSFFEIGDAFVRLGKEIEYEQEKENAQAETAT